MRTEIAASYVKRFLIALTGGFIALGSADVRAAKAPLSPDELKEAASHIIHGKVVGMSSKVQTSKVERAFGTHRDRVFTIELKVDAVLKGSGLKAGDEIEVEAWQPSSRIPPLPGLQGHETIPEKGDTVAVYIEGKTGKAYEPILPNGIVILGGADAPVAEARGGVHNKSLQPPRDVPPVIGTAVATPSTAEGDDDKWSIKLVVPKVAWEVIGEERPKLEWPKFNVTVEEATRTLPMGYHPATQLSDNAQNRLLDLKGRRLRRDEALKRLAAKTPVLVSVSGEMPDPFYLQFTKPDTLIVVLGIPTAPAPELLPQPSVANKAERTKHSLASANETAEPESKQKPGDQPDAKQPKPKTQAIEVFVDLSLGLCDEQTAKKRLETLKAKNLKAALEAEIEATEGDLVGIRQVTGQRFVALTRQMEIVSSGMSIAALGVSRDRAYLEVNVFLTSRNRYVAVVTTELAGLPKEVVNKLRK